jgi:N4-gp56 family major capsid protein
VAINHVNPATTPPNLINSLTAPPGATTNHWGLGTAAQQKFFVLTLTKRAVPYLVLFEDAQMTTIPKNSGGFGTEGRIMFRKIAALWDPATDGAVGVAPAPLTEGVPPVSKNLTISEVWTELKQYGDWIKVSDLAETASVDGILVHAAEALGEYEGQKLHRVMLFALEATTNSWWGAEPVVGSGPSGLVTPFAQPSGSQTALPAAGPIDTDAEITAAMKMNAATIRKLVRQMKVNNAARFPDGFYHMIIDPYVGMDLLQDSEFTDLAKYNGGMAQDGGINLLTGELGKGWGVRFKEANELLTGISTTSVKTFHSYLYGPNGFGMLDLAGMAVRKIDPRTNRGVSIYSQPVNQPDKSDPLGQVGFVSCKVAFAGIVFDPVQVMKVVTAAGA